MNELYATVIRHLKSQRESASAEKLWNELWQAFENDGPEGVSTMLENLVELPKSEESGD
jgi:hypothetical protein